MFFSSFIFYIFRKIIINKKIELNISNNNITTYNNEELKEERKEINN
jgi:hypothetical protein